MWFTYSTFMWLLSSVSSNMNHQNILGLKWCPLSPTTPLRTRRFINGRWCYQSRNSIVNIQCMPLSAIQTAFPSGRGGGALVATFNMLTMSLWFTYSTFVRLLPRVSSHMNHQHILSLKWCPSPLLYHHHKVYRWYNNVVHLQYTPTYTGPYKVPTLPYYTLHDHKVYRMNYQNTAQSAYVSCHYWPTIILFLWRADSGSLLYA